MKPFLKWAGGKRWLSNILVELLQNYPGPYREPFLGGGTLYFARMPAQAELSDINEELINTYRVVRDDVESLIRCLQGLDVDRLTFDTLRGISFHEDVHRAARFIYLNRAAFNGLYRVNREGKFNVPFGCKLNTTACNEQQLRDASTSLQTAKLCVGDFRATMTKPMKESVLFLDPPYTVKHNNNGFRRYNECIFSWKDQVDLAALAKVYARKGAAVVATNAWHNDVVALYDNRYFRTIRVNRPSNMAADVKHRGRFDEVLIVSRSIDALPLLIEKIRV